MNPWSISIFVCFLLRKTMNELCIIKDEREREREREKCTPQLLV
uniref:Uncharacterized protein n=1 Tax=Arundo donax TaxID=35708 RepID=A0A0A9H1T2_ARUDO